MEFRGWERKLLISTTSRGLLLGRRPQVPVWHKRTVTDILLGLNLQEKISGNHHNGPPPQGGGPGGFGGQQGGYGGQQG